MPLLIRRPWDFSSFIFVPVEVVKVVVQRLVKRNKEFTVKRRPKGDPADRTSVAGRVAMDGHLAGQVASSRS